MNLTASTHSLELVTASAVNTTFEASWTEIDKTSTTAVVPGSNQALVTTATDTTLVAAPSGANLYRAVSSVSICNVGGASQSVTVQKDVSGTEYEVARATLGVGESLKYERGRGWYVLTAAGEVSAVGAAGADGTDGGGTILGSGTSVVDFGAGASHATVTVTGQAAILAGSLVYVWIKPEATADHSADEHMVETIKVFASDIVAGVGFTINAFNTSQRFEPVRPMESLRARYSGTGQDAGRGQAPRGTTNTVGGRGTQIKGEWSVGWMYTQ